MTKQKPANTIEAYGNKGFKNTPWRKTFRSYQALATWAEKNDADVLGTRTIEGVQKLAHGVQDDNDEGAK